MGGGVTVTDRLLEMVRANLRGERAGIYSICSANRFVLEAGMMEAGADESIICIESTSNQVNQFGGYIGMTPLKFAGFVRAMAAEAGIPPDRIILGGDHLGPHVWQSEPADGAMSKARELVRSCVLAGYAKIHLDASMRCAGDPGDSNAALDEHIITERAADLCFAAEAAHLEMPPASPAPVYVIGTEVPIPGGEQAGEQYLSVTRVADVERTITLAREAFLARGIGSAWERVIAVVVQPGVEFGDAKVFDYQPDRAEALSSYLQRNWRLVFEAHSTDYQLPEALRKMVEDHFAILKVGPWLTYAFREAVFALGLIEEELLSSSKGVIRSGIRIALESAMISNPGFWNEYYLGDAAYQGFARKYSFSDRIRYYWPSPAVRSALARLLENLSQRPIPLTLLSQHLPLQYEAVRSGRIPNLPGSLIHDKILAVLDIYARACGMKK